MPTENRRVATYLPKELDDRLKAFITERNLKGESQALITILSEFFDVSYPVARQVDYSDFVSQDQFKDLLDKVSELSEAFEKSKASSAVNLLLGKMQRLESRMESLEGSEDSRKEIKPETLPGQLDLLTDAESDLLSSSKGELPKVEQSSSRYALLRELVSKPTDEPQVSKDSDSPSKTDSDSLAPEAGDSPHDMPGELSSGLRGVKLAERLKVDRKVIERRRDKADFSSWSSEEDFEGVAWQYHPESRKYYPYTAKTSSQVNPLPEGSERSGEG